MKDCVILVQIIFAYTCCAKTQQWFWMEPDFFFFHCELNVAKRLYACIHYVMQVISGGMGFLFVCLQYYRPGKWLKFFINLNPCHNNYGQVAFSMPSYFVQSFCILFKLLKWHMFVDRQTGICNQTILKEWQFWHLNVQKKRSFHSYLEHHSLCCWSWNKYLNWVFPHLGYNYKWNQDLKNKISWKYDIGEVSVSDSSCALNVHMTCHLCIFS